MSTAPEDPRETEVVAALVARERELEARLVEARGQAEAMVEAARARGEALVRRAREEQQGLVQAALRRNQEELRRRADRRLAWLRELSGRLDTVDGARVRDLGRRVLEEIFPELAAPGTGGNRRT